MSSDKHTLPKPGSDPKMAEQRKDSLETDGTRRRSQTYRRMSSFDLPHVDEVLTDVTDVDTKAGEFANVPWWTSQRFLLSIICFFGFVMLYAQRVNLSIAIVTMVIHASSPDLNITSVSNVSVASTPGTPTDELCPELQRAIYNTGEFHWDKKLQGLLLGGFYWGYLLLQVPGGRLAETYGAKNVITFGMLPVSLLTIISPLAARANPWFFLVVRVLIGVGSSVMYPAVQAMWSHWSPPNERSRLIGFSYAGGQFGNAIIFPISGFLCAYGFDGGWPSVFYVIGAAGVIWCILWIVFAADTPDGSRYIGDLEKRYIKFCVGQRAKRKKGPTPWRAILTSRAMWAIIISHMCGNYGAYMLLTQIPSYMKEVLKFDIKANGVFSMLPYLMFWACITISGMIADFLISREILTVAQTRKLMTSIGMIGPGSFLIGTGFMECHQATGAVVMLTLAVGLCGFHFSGYFINHGDVAPPFAGTMFGISNTAATIPGILAPFIVAAMTPNGSREEWQAAFYVAAAIYFFGAIYYCFMGLGEIQEWAKTEEDKVTPGLHEIPATLREEDEDADNKKLT